MSRHYRRGDGPGGPDPDSAEGRDVGLNDHTLPGGQPHIKNRAVLPHAPVGEPHRPLYGGHMAHGVATDLDFGGRIPHDPEGRSMYEATGDVLTEPAPDPAHLAPIPVTIVSGGAGKGLKRHAAYGHVTVPAAGQMPVRLAGRDLTRKYLYLLNPVQTAPAPLYAAPGSFAGTLGSISAPTAGTVITNSGIWLPSGLWNIAWTVGFTVGTPAAAENNNFGVYAPAATLLATSVNLHAAVPVSYPQATFQLTVPVGGLPVVVKAIASATAGVTYTAQLTATLANPGATALVSQGASTTGPAAGTVIGSATQSSEQDLGAGTYTANWITTLSGTITAAEANNYGLYLGTTLLAISANPPVAGSYVQPPVTFTVPAAGGKLAVKAIASAGVSAVYGCNLQATYQAGGTGVWLSTNPQDLVVDASLLSPSSISGAYLPPNMSGYMRIGAQSEVFAISATPVPVVVSVIQEYEIREP